MDVETLDLAQLVDLLDDLEGKRTPVGWKPDDAVRTCASGPETSAGRLPLKLIVEVAWGGKSEVVSSSIG